VGLITEHGGGSEYEAVTLPQADSMASRDTAVFLRRSARPSRRAVLHLYDLRGSFVPADLARWYNERGFHFYVTGVEVTRTITTAPRRRRERSLRPDLMALDAARRYLREAGGIDALILSAEGPAVRSAAQWCDARRAVRPVEALILSDPDFGRTRRARLDIGCPVLVISVACDRATSDGRPDVWLGPHVTWLTVGDQAAEGTPPDTAASGTVPPGTATPDTRRWFFDEMGRWLGAYMYGQVRDQLL
jgi:hypothetical protein